MTLLIAGLIEFSDARGLRADSKDISIYDGYEGLLRAHHYPQGVHTRLFLKTDCGLFFYFFLRFIFMNLQHQPEWCSQSPFNFKYSKRNRPVMWVGLLCVCNKEQWKNPQLRLEFVCVLMWCVQNAIKVVLLYI